MMASWSHLLQKSLMENFVFRPVMIETENFTSLEHIMYRNIY